MTGTQLGGIWRHLLTAWCLLSVAPASASELITVCKSGCSYSSLQAALDAAAPGDIVEVTAGETFDENIFLPHKEGTDYITVRSSRWQELPPREFRVNPSDHAYLMPQVRSANTDPVLRAGRDAKYVVPDGINVDADTFNLHETSFANGSPVTVDGASVPEPLVRGTTYYVRDVSGATFRLAATPAGPAIDITSVGSANNSSYYARTHFALVNNAHHYRFVGIDFCTKPGANNNMLILIGWNEMTLPAVPQHIEFDRVLIRGLQNESGPRFCLALNGAYLSITDSWIGHCKAFADESKAVYMGNTPGPVLIQNNHLSAASISILTAGQGSAIPEQVISNVAIRGNHIVKHGYMHYKAGAGAPSGACYYGQGSGAFYRDTSVTPNTCANGACYVCKADGTWEQRTDATYRNTHYLTKGGIEFKDGENVLIENNVVEAVFAGPDTGNTPCIAFVQLGQGGSYHYIGNATAQNNLCKDTWGGLHSTSDNDASLTTSNHNVHFLNNLVTGMGRFPEMSYWPNPGDVPSRPISFTNGQPGLVYDHNTFRPSSYQGSHGILLIGGKAEFGSMVPSYLTNNIVQGGTYGTYMDGDYSCADTGFGKWFGTASSPKYVANLVMYDAANGSYFRTCNPVSNWVLPTRAQVGFVSDTNHRLSPSSPFSASCQSNCQFAGTDGKDMGPDIDKLEDLLSGVVLGVPNWSQQAVLRAEPGATAAIIQYTAPGPQACSLRLYTSPGRTPGSQHADTLVEGGDLDSRPGNVFEGLDRQFVLGRNTALTPETQYYYILRCNERTMPGEFKTKAAGTEPQYVEIALQDAAADNAVIEYDSNPDLQNAVTADPVSFAPAQTGVRQVKLRFSIPPGQIRYARWKKRDGSNNTIKQGPVRAYAAP